MTVKGKILDETIISDLKNYGVITYENNASGIESFKKKIRTALKKFEEVPDRPDNPVFDFLKTEDLVLNTFERKMTANRLVGFLNELLSNLNISEGITSKKFKIEAEFVTNKRMKTDAYKFLVTTNYHIFNNNATIVFHSSISWLDALNHYLELLDKSMIENINDEYRNNIIKEIHIRAIKVTDRLKEMIEIINEEIQSLKQNKFQDYEPLIVYHDPEHKKLIEKK
ncbi:hypothetical protein K0U27_06965 [archaeon]|nr:hypothetical protein [archaeon]